ncbi:fumarate reductase [membrane anchor subunit] frdD [Mycobacterium tuberculosis GM 1503]|nr:fumarate reductase [membrane anchor subunit] frdD [Mycobacterium tuberculosis GM 1503]
MTPSTSDARSRRRSAEPFLWLLFSAGGMVTALVAPVLLLLFGLAFRSGGSTRPTTGTYWRWCATRSPSLLCWSWWYWPCSHAAHRFRFVLRPWAATGPVRPSDRPVVLPAWPCWARRRRVGCCSTI